MTAGPGTVDIARGGAPATATPGGAAPDATPGGAVPDAASGGVVGAPPGAAVRRTALWGEQRAERALAQACGTLSLDVAAAVLVSDAANAVYRVGDLALRVTPAATAGPQRLRAINAALLLRADGVSLLPTVAEPIATPDGTVTVWPWLADGRAATWGELGGLLARFHAVRRGGPLPLPEWNPTHRLDQRVDRYAASPHAEAAVTDALRRAVLHSRALLSAVRFTLPWGPVHGHPTPSNAVVHPGGAALVDFDQMTLGPREWDLCLPSLHAARGDATDADVRAFARAYGPGVPEPKTCAALVAARQVSYACFLATRVEGGPDAGPDAGPALDALRAAVAALPTG